jgi:hypothetical protein
MNSHPSSSANPPAYNTDIQIASLGRSTAARLVHKYPKTLDAIRDSRTTPKQIVDTLVTEYPYGDVDRLIVMVLTALQSKTGD